MQTFLPYSVELTYRGLAITGEVSPYDPGVWTLSNGDPGYPPEGGSCEDFTWEVADIDEVLTWTDLPLPLENMVRALWRICRQLPATLQARIDSDWEDEIRTAVEEAFYNQCDAD